MTKEEYEVAVRDIEEQAQKSKAVLCRRYVLEHPDTRPAGSLIHSDSGEHIIVQKVLTYIGLGRTVPEAVYRGDQCSKDGKPHKTKKVIDIYHSRLRKE